MNTKLDAEANRLGYRKFTPGSYVKDDFILTIQGNGTAELSGVVGIIKLTSPQFTLPCSRFEFFEQQMRNVLVACGRLEAEELAK